MNLLRVVSQAEKYIQTAATFPRNRGGYFADRKRWSDFVKEMRQNAIEQRTIPFTYSQLLVFGDGSSVVVSNRFQENAPGAIELFVMED